MSQEYMIPHPQPKDRDWIVFERYAIRGVSREEVARSFGISEQEVLAIASRVNEHATVRLFHGHPDLMRCVLLERLEHQWREAMDAWYLSRQEEETRSVSTEEAETDRQGTGKRRRARQTKRSRTGDVRYLVHARSLLHDLRWMHGIEPKADDPHANDLTVEERKARIRMIMTQIVNRLEQDRERPAEGYNPLESFLKAEWDPTANKGA